MPLLIDGYNLLHVTGIVGHGSDLTALHRSREALLQFLAASIEPAERSQTTIVFDAAGAPLGLPRTLVHDQITVEFARDYADADTMLEELIAAHKSPRSLVVVSSDHRVQRAARRRRAKAVDSDRWYAELCASRKHARTLEVEPTLRPTATLSPREVAYWLGQFTVESKEESDDTSNRPNKKSTKKDDLANPFPPGYGEDLIDDSEC